MSYVNSLRQGLVYTLGAPTVAYLQHKLGNWADRFLDNLVDTGSRKVVNWVYKSNPRTGDYNSKYNWYNRSRHFANYKKYRYFKGSRRYISYYKKGKKRRFLYNP